MSRICFVVGGRSCSVRSESARWSVISVTVVALDGVLRASRDLTTRRTSFMFAKNEWERLQERLRQGFLGNYRETKQAEDWRKKQLRHVLGQEAKLTPAEWAARPGGSIQGRPSADHLTIAYLRRSKHSDSSSIRIGFYRLLGHP